MPKIRKVVPEISNDEYDVVLSVGRTGVFLSGGRGVFLSCAAPEPGRGCFHQFQEIPVVGACRLETGRESDVFDRALGVFGQ